MLFIHSYIHILKKSICGKVQNSGYVWVCGCHKSSPRFFISFLRAVGQITACGNGYFLAHYCSCVCFSLRLLQFFPSFLTCWFAAFLSLSAVRAGHWALGAGQLCRERISFYRVSPCSVLCVASSLSREAVEPMPVRQPERHFHLLLEIHHPRNLLWHRNISIYIHIFITIS